MKGLGIVLIVVGVLLLFGAIFSSINRPPADVDRSGLRVASDNGESMAILPLLGIVSLATGGALITASVLTRKG
jgi:hypothetical protein